MKVWTRELPLFNGNTIIPEFDERRLAGQYLRVWNVMRPGFWLTLREIQDKIQFAFGVYDSESAISARLRDFRKPKWGSHTVNRRRRGMAERGLHEYQLII